MKPLRLPSTLNSLFRPNICSRATKVRWAHHGSSPRQIPPPIPFVPDVQTFLAVIGRGLSQHASKFPTWDALFSLTSHQMKELGIEPARTRRYLLAWRQRFRQGHFGIGGDLKHVDNGVAELKIHEVEKERQALLKRIVNVPLGRKVEEVPPDEMVKVKGYHVKGARTITGPYVLPMKDGEGARIQVTEGMWEDRRGRKVDGGERRRAEVRFKRRVAERKAEREAALLSRL